MSFASYDFLFSFLPIAVFVTWIALFVDAKRLLIPTIIIISVVFYGHTSLPHLILLLTLILISWCAGYAFDKTDHSFLKKTIIFSGVTINLLSLLVWKYGASLIETWNMMGWIQAQDPGLIMPLGISFYALQMIGFLLDLQRGKTTVSPLPSFAAFVLFFPQLLAGPIVSHRRMMGEFDKARGELSFDKRTEMAALGIAWIAIGLFKKAVIADSLGRITIPMIVGASVRELTILQAWEIVLASGARIYFDFSGYCDMAVGIGLLFGIKLPANFNAPMRLATISDGWRRWHITFHNFLRDHVYRHLRNLLGTSKLAVAVSTVTVFLISALWHGNSVVFLVWGLFCGVGWIGLTALSSLPASRHSKFAKASLAIALYMFLPIMFVTPDLGTSFFVAGKLFDVSQIPQTLAAFNMQDFKNVAMIFGVALFVTSEISTQTLLSDQYNHRDRHFFGYRPPIWAPNIKWALFIIILLGLGFYYVGKSPPFVYFRF